MYKKGHQRVAMIPDASSPPHQKETPPTTTSADRANAGLGTTTKCLWLLQAPMQGPKRKQCHALWLWYLLGCTDSLFTSFQLWGQYGLLVHVWWGMQFAYRKKQYTWWYHNWT